MKLFYKSLIVLFAVGFALTAQSATVLKLTFDSAPVVDDATYDFAVGDIPASGTVSTHFTPAYGKIDYGWDHSGSTFIFPDDYTDSGNYPDIVTPTTAGNQGGNAMFTSLGDSGDPCKHIGYNISETNGITVSGDFTAEAVFMTNMLDPQGAEWGLQNIFGNEGVTDATRGEAAWKFRIWPTTQLSGTGQMQLWTGNTVTYFGETDVDGPTVTASVWHHVACAYTASTNTLELFYDGASQGSINPTWANQNQSQWWIGEWPNNPAPRQFAGWIDAVAISDTVLAPGSFAIESSAINNWMDY